MVSAREWLDKEYPMEKRKNITELEVTNNNLEGELRLKDFDNLEKLECYGNSLTSLIVQNCTKLKDLDCSSNKLVILNLNDCCNLRELDCSFNNLTDLNFLSSLNVDNLISLNIINNDFPKQDLTVFASLLNLKHLWIGNDDKEKIKDNVYNKFFGSLKPLNDLVKLESLNISNTDIDEGLEYLPDSVRYVYCLSSEQQLKERGTEKIVDGLKRQGFSLIDEDEEKYEFDESLLKEFKEIKKSRTSRTEENNKIKFRKKI